MDADQRIGMRHCTHVYLQHFALCTLQPVISSRESCVDCLEDKGARDEKLIQTFLGW